MTRGAGADKKHFLLLGIIYLGFISLGLPDSVLGVAWPKMGPDFARPVESAGLLVTVTTICSVFSSVSGGVLSARLNCGVILACSGLLTTSAMFGYAASSAWPAVILFTIPLGLGQGSIDAALNSYVAKNYSARHMNWLHCCWGVGATGAPFVMTAALGLGLSWRAGYAAIAAMQAAFTALFFLTFKLWKYERAAPCAGASADGSAAPQKAGAAMERGRLFRRAAAGCAFYFLYPGLETVLGLWGASLLYAMGVPVKTVGLIVALFWGSLTLGRLMTGAFLDGFTDRAIIRGALFAVGAGILTLISAKSPIPAAAAFALIGFGCAPLYPCMMHDTPRRVGEFADRVIGLQVGSGFVGASAIPALVGFAAARWSMVVVAPVMLGFALAIALAHEISAAGHSA